MTRPDSHDGQRKVFYRERRKRSQGSQETWLADASEAVPSKFFWPALLLGVVGSEGFDQSVSSGLALKPSGNQYQPCWWGPGSPSSALGQWSSSGGR